MAKIQIEVETPFEWCEGCRMFALEEEIYEVYNGMDRFTKRTCANASICLNTYEQRARFYNEKNGEKK